MIDRAVIAFMLSNSWLVHRPVIEDLARIVLRHASGQRLGADQVAAIVAARDARVASREAEWERAGLEVSDGRPYQVAGSVAVVQVSGLLCKYSHMINGVSQPVGVTHAGIVMALEAAVEDPKVRSAVLVIDSPGGTAAGMADLEAGVRRYRESGKGLVAYCQDHACSGAYWLAAMCDWVVCNSLTLMGSIGAVRIVEDSSKQAEMEGIKVHVVSSGPYKGAGAPGSEVTGEHLADAQREIDALAARFADSVAEWRRPAGLTRRRVGELATGQCWMGEENVRLGLADEVEDDVVALVQRMNDAGDRLARR